MAAPIPEPSVAEVDGLVSGVIHSTANTIRPALQLIKTEPGCTLVSSVFFMLPPFIAGFDVGIASTYAIVCI